MPVRVWRKGNSPMLLVGDVSWCTQYAKKVWRFLKKKKIELPYNPVVPLLGISGKDKNSNLKRYMHPNVHSSIICHCKGMEVTWVSINRWIKKIEYGYTMEYYSAIKKNKIPFAATWMDLEGIVLTETSKTEKDKYCMISLTWGI